MKKKDLIESSKEYHRDHWPKDYLNDITQSNKEFIEIDEPVAKNSVNRLLRILSLNEKDLEFISPYKESILTILCNIINDYSLSRDDGEVIHGESHTKAMNFLGQIEFLNETSENKKNRKVSAEEKKKKYKNKPLPKREQRKTNRKRVSYLLDYTNDNIKDFFFFFLSSPEWENEINYSSKEDFNMSINYLNKYLRTFLIWFEARHIGTCTNDSYILNFVKALYNPKFLPDIDELEVLANMEPSMFEEYMNYSIDDLKKKIESETKQKLKAALEE